MSNFSESKKNPRNHSFYLTNEEIGEGGFGKVYIAKDRLKEEKKYVAKEIKNYKSIKDSLKESHITNELLIGTELYNKNLVKIFEPFYANEKFYFICEYCNGNNLHELYKNKININEEIVQKIMKDTLFGLSALHRNGIIHHDLKEANILINFKDLNDLNNKNYLKADFLISDFGLSKYKDNRNNNTGGTNKYLPPEKIELIFNQNDDSIFNESIDIWAIGIITYQLLFKSNPFLDKNFNPKGDKNFVKQKMYENLYANMIKNGKYEIDWKKNNVSYELICFLDSCLKKLPKNRETSENLEFSRFITRDIKKFHKIDQNYFNKLPNKYKKDDKIILNIYDEMLIKNNREFNP
jgi:serine/threonine protein kinase